MQTTKPQATLNAAADRPGIAVNYLPGRFNSHVDREHTRSLDGIVGAHLHWIKGEPVDGLARYYEEEAKELFWRD